MDDRQEHVSRYAMFWWSLAVGTITLLLCAWLHRRAGELRIVVEIMGLVALVAPLIFASAISGDEGFNSKWGIRAESLAVLISVLYIVAAIAASTL